MKNQVHLSDRNTQQIGLNFVVILPVVIICFSVFGLGGYYLRNHSSQNLVGKKKTPTSSPKFNTTYSDFSELKKEEVLVQDGYYYGPPFDPNLYQLEVGQYLHFFAKSYKVNLKQYLGKLIKVYYREVKGVVMGEQQLVIVDSVE